MGEQSNAYRILLRYDRKSRHRRIKKQRRYERLAATSQLSLPCPPGAACLGGRSYLERSRGSAAPRLICGPFLAGETAAGRRGQPVAARASSHLGALARQSEPAPASTPAGASHCYHREMRVGNFSGTSSLKFRGTKGSIGHTFMVCIHTENQNQGDFCPFALLEISVLHESPLGHLRYGLTDVPPQPNSPLDDVIHPDRPVKDLSTRNRAAKPGSALWIK